MRIKKCRDEAVILWGLCIDRGSETKIEVMDYHGDEIFSLNGKSCRMENGCAVIKTADFIEEENNIKFYSGGKWYPVRGIVRVGEQLKYSDAFVQETLGKYKLLIEQLLELVGKNEKNISEIEKRITGESFL